MVAVSAQGYARPPKLPRQIRRGRRSNPLSVRTPSVASLSIAVLAALLAADPGFGDPAADSFQIPGPPLSVSETARRGARLLAKGIAALERGDLFAAQLALEQAGSIELLSDYASYYQARLLLESDDPQRAAAASREARQRYPDSVLAGAFSRLLGDALLAAGDDTGAREAWQTALTQVRDDEQKIALRSAITASEARTGALHAGVRRDGEPDTSVGTISEITPGLLDELVSSRELLRRADEALAQRRSSRALALYDRALAGELSDGDRRRARMQRGHCLFRLRRYDEARESFGALTADPEARFWHARALARSGRVEAAIAEFETAAETAPPELSGWALYLAGTLLENRDEVARAMELYRQVASREEIPAPATDALWRLGWFAYRGESYNEARRTFLDLAGRQESPLSALRPRYWAARSAEKVGQTEISGREFAELASNHPFSYYGWRAAERLRAVDLEPPLAARPKLLRGSSGIERRELERVALLLEADLATWARQELQSISVRARGVSDRTALGRLFVRAGDYHHAQRLVVDAYAESLSRGVHEGEEALWWLSWPPAYREIIDEVLPRDAVIEPALVWAIMREESSYRPEVTSSAGARGLLQIMPSTGEQLARNSGYANFDPDDLYQPRVSIELGTLYLDQLGRRFPGRLSAAIGSYNAGPTAVSGWLTGDQAQRDDDVWVEDIPYKQTRSYVKRVLRSLHVYRSFYRAGS